MQFVIVNTDTHRHTNKLYTSFRRAQNAAVKTGKLEPEWRVMPYKEWFLEDKLVTVTSLLTNKPVQIRRSEVGTCCDPSTERFWSY
jgi:hypothetical protein